MTADDPEYTLCPRATGPIGVTSKFVSDKFGENESLSTMSQAIFDFQDSKSFGCKWGNVGFQKSARGGCGVL